jgi:hypothetical protein
VKDNSGSCHARVHYSLCVTLLDSFHIALGPFLQRAKVAITIYTARTLQSASEQEFETHRNQRSTANLRQNEVHLQEEDARCAQCCDGLIRKWPRLIVTSIACVLTQGGSPLDRAIKQRQFSRILQASGCFPALRALTTRSGCRGRSTRSKRYVSVAGIRDMALARRPRGCGVACI